MSGGVLLALLVIGLWLVALTIMVVTKGEEINSVLDVIKAQDTREGVHPADEDHLP